MHGSIWWNELNTRDPEAARAFHARVFGWEIEAMPMAGGGTYLVCKQGDRPVAGIFDLRQIPDIPDTIPSHWMTYIAVDDVDASAETVRAAGGRVAKAPFDVEGVGRIAMIMDSTGGMVGIMTPAPQPG